MNKKNSGFIAINIDVYIAELPNELKFELIGSKTFLNQVRQDHYKRKY